MSTGLSLNETIDKAFLAIITSNDFSDATTTASFMILFDEIISAPKEILKLDENKLSLLSLISSTIITSGFTKRFPTYNKYDTGEIICSVGFYTFMKQIKNDNLQDSFLPGFIVLIHDGREQIAQLIEKYMLPDNSNTNIYNVFDIIEYKNSEYKKYSITKGIELYTHGIFRSRGLRDENINRWYLELETEKNKYACP